ncbi:Uncharacterised protein [Mycoplasmopsis maculosa]|uniref:Uncharacterized protein n=1 Tax=Mycoplasmopsis maculosa TaxID=114885 RepID=A0A449B3Z9_9BACT|nr:hypothetical protein [Mycoplasmopsis maculosa]VEU75299.1 Uncharacterised protein [Mycoplasmopsis maculosa]
MKQYETKINFKNSLTFYYEISFNASKNKNILQNFGNIIFSIIENNNLIDKNKYWKNIWNKIKNIWKKWEYEANKKGLNLDLNKFIDFIKSVYLNKIIQTVNISYENSKFNENDILIYINNFVINKNEFYEVFFENPIAFFKLNQIEKESYIKEVSNVFKYTNSDFLEYILNFIKNQIIKFVNDNNIKINFEINQLIPNWYGRIMRRQYFKI